jgi:ATP-binding cassette, subfamily B, bacterial
MDLKAHPLLRCLALYRRTPWRFALTALLYAAVNASLAWQQSLVGRAVHDVERGVAVVRRPDGGLDGHVALLWLGILTTVVSVRSAVQYLAGITGLLIQQQLLSHLRELIFTQVQTLDLTYHWKHGAGEMVTRTTRDSDKVRDALTSFWRQVVDTIFAVAAGIGLLFWYSPGLGAVPLVLTLAGIGIFIRQTDHLVTLDRKVGAAYDQVNQDLAEGIYGVRVIKAFAQEPARIRRFESEVAVFVEQALAALAYASSRIPVPQLVIASGQVWVLGYGAHLVLTGSLNLGELVAALLAVNVLVLRVETIGRIIQTFADARSSAGRIWDLLDARPTILSGWSKCPAGTLGLRLEQVRVAPVRDGNPALENCTFHIAPGEAVALVGPTGSGKSTLGNLPPRLLDADRGQVLIGSDESGWRDVRTVDLHDLRKRVHVVSQEAFLFSDTLAANLRLAAPEATEEQLRWALRQAAAEELLDSLPEGLNTLLGDRGVTLSGGQRQRLCLARALLAQPSLLILDDATSALDALTELEVLDNFRRLRREHGGRITLLLITSRLSTILLSDRVAVLVGGRIVAQGPHVTLAGTSREYTELMGISRGDG